MTLSDALEAPRRVCVMDASGQIGSPIVEKLLLKGYIVNASLLNSGNSECLDKLSRCSRLKVFRSDPFNFQSIVDALEGCCGLIYCFELPSDHPIYDENLVDVEVRAAQNVLEACAQSRSIEKVIYTSSVTAIVWNSDRNNYAVNLDERNWSDISFCKKFKLWHALSKTLAEKSAWALAMDRGINMVAINGGLLMNSELSITNPYLKGASEMYEDGVLVTVRPEFIAEAHICAFESSSSYGRYICYDHAISSNEDAVKLARHLLPSFSSESTLPRFDDIKICKQRLSNMKFTKLITNYR